MNSRIAVITPTTGSPLLRRCLSSVSEQTYSNIVHVVVVDGADRMAAAESIIGESNSVHVIALPEVTGDGGYQGHRIYAALPFLLNADYICYLDEDNWFDFDHIEILVRLAEKHSLQWAYSLRKIVRRDGTLLCNDDCASLGRWPAYDGGYNHVDTNCYLLRRVIACEMAQAWNRTNIHGQGAADRLVCAQLMQKYPYFHTSGSYTVNYRLGGRLPEAGSARFYLTGNDIYSKIYSHYPWRIMTVDSKSPYHPHLQYAIDANIKAMAEDLSKH